jgi:hypothetical protein
MTLASADSLKSLIGADGILAKSAANTAWSASEHEIARQRFDSGRAKLRAASRFFLMLTLSAPHYLQA